MSRYAKTPHQEDAVFSVYKSSAYFLRRAVVFRLAGLRFVARFFGAAFLRVVFFAALRLVVFFFATFRLAGFRFAVALRFFVVRFFGAAFLRVVFFRGAIAIIYVMKK